MAVVHMHHIQQQKQRTHAHHWLIGTLLMIMVICVHAAPAELAAVVDDPILLSLQGDEALQSGELSRALKLLKQLYAMHTSAIERGDGGLSSSLQSQALGGMGMAYVQSGEEARGITYMERAVKVWESLTADEQRANHEEMARAVFNLAFTYERQDRVDEALQRYERAIELNPSFGDAMVQAANIRNKQQDYNSVVSLLQRAIPLLPDQHMLYMHLGDTLNNLKKWHDAITSYKKGLAADPSNAQWHVHIGDALLNLRQLDDALIHYKRAVNMAPQDETALIGLLDVKQELANWDNWDALVTRVRAAIKRTLTGGEASPLSPYQSLFLPLTPKEQMDIAVSWAMPAIADARRAVDWTTPYHKQKRTTSVPITIGALSSSSSSRKLKIGYLSRRFHNYAGTQLMLRVFGLHDRERVTVYAYANGAADGSEQRATVMRDAHVFVDIHGSTPQQAAMMIAADGIDILIDYDGAHNFNSFSILALRPAPVQMTYLGFAGTSGARGIIDYIITDRIITPPSAAIHFTEKLAYLPHQYQPQDHLAEISDRVFTREELGLPATGFVFTCFNRLDKVEPSMWAAWMTILSRVAGSVLWLAASHTSAVANLQRTAAAQGIAAHRLIWSSKTPLKSDHYARHRAADLFLDTRYYNAHTTATDALWAGLPVLTLPGSTLASRVAASLVTAAGLSPHLVATSLDDYITRAVSLATNTAIPSLQQLRRTLVNDRASHPLFDTPLYVRGMEDLYVTVWNEWINGSNSGSTIASSSTVPSASSTITKSEL